jgi:hypothetical protein
MESEVLPGDGGCLRRLHNMWTCDHYSELNGQFLGGIFGRRAIRDRTILTPFARGTPLDTDRMPVENTPRRIDGVLQTIYTCAHFATARINFEANVKGMVNCMKLKSAECCAIGAASHAP